MVYYHDGQGLHFFLNRDVKHTKTTLVNFPICKHPHSQHSGQAQNDSRCLGLEST